MAPRTGHIFKPLRQRLEEKCIPEPNSGCWIWMGADNARGYGTLTLGHSKREYAHRAMYELDRGPIPEGMMLDHVCRNTFCINPHHLEPVTNAENTKRGRVSALRQRADACKRGHPRDAFAYIDSVGSVQCRACLAMRGKAYRERKRNVHA